MRSPIPSIWRARGGLTPRFRIRGSSKRSARTSCAHALPTRERQAARSLSSTSTDAPLPSSVVTRASGIRRWNACRPRARFRWARRVSLVINATRELVRHDLQHVAGVWRLAGSALSALGANVHSGSNVGRSPDRRVAERQAAPVAQLDASCLRVTQSRSRLRPSLERSATRASQTTVAGSLCDASAGSAQARS